ncbi:MAG: DNA gyrase inhibitor YacG [Desulfuromonadaceae bacterium]|nr:DNA gyrase inhibitor YacG [Desulfuromonadaceae bacterium]
MSTPLHQQQNLRTMIQCPTCQQPTLWQDNPHRPFCSDRCRLLDLGCWADEEYRVPAEDGGITPESLENFE